MRPFQLQVLSISPSLIGQGEHNLQGTPVGHLLITTVLPLGSWLKAMVSTFEPHFQTFGFLYQMPRLTESQSGVAQVIGGKQFMPQVLSSSLFHTVGLQEVL